MPIILSLFINRALGLRRTSNQIDSDVICPRSCDQRKITKKDGKTISVEKKRFFKKKNPAFFAFFKSGFFVRKKVFFSLKKTQKPILNCFYCTMQYHRLQKLHSDNLLYLLWHSNLRVKKCTPSLFSQSVVGQCARQTEKSHSYTNPAVSRQVYVHALLVQHIYSVFF